MTTTVARRLIAVPDDPKQHARVIAEAVDEAWHGAFGGSRIEVPVSVVAALALVSRYDPDGPDPAEIALRLAPDGFAALLLNVWTRFVVLRPDLAPRVKPLWEWLDVDELDEVLLRAVHAAGRAALRRGLLQLTGVRERRHEVDVLGTVLQTVRWKSSQKGLGQFLTPDCVTELIGRILAPEAGTRVMEPCAGTGTMLLGAAQAMRAKGVDPAAAEWWANDIDWLAAACCAVNVHLWGLGPRVVVGCGDGLTNTWLQEALTQRQAAIDEVDRLWRLARQQAAVRNLLGLPTPEDPLARYLAAAQPPPPKAAPPHSSTFDAEAAYRQPSLF